MPINSLPVRQEVTAESLRNLFNNCAALRSISREHEKYFQERVPIGTTLQIKRPWKPVGRQGQAFQPEPVVQTTVPLSISYWRGVDFVYNDVDEALFFNMEDFHKEYSRPAGIQLGQLIDGDLLTFMQQTIPNFVGTPGTIPTTNATYNAARTSLNKLLAPDNDRSIIWTSDFEQAFIGTNSTVFNPQEVIGKEFLTGVVGKYAGFDMMRDEQIPGFTVGTYAGSGVVSTAGQTGTSITTTGWNSASLSLNPGDRFTIQNVFKVNPQGARSSYSGTANLMQFVVTQPVTDSSGAATINFFPAIIPSGQFQNCSNSPATNAPVTIQGTSGQQVNTAFAIQKDAYTAAFLKLMKPANVECVVMGGEEAGTPGVYIRSLTQWQSSGPYQGYNTERMDVIYGFAGQYNDYMSTVIYG